MTRATSSNKSQRSSGGSSGQTTGKGRSTAKGRSTTQRSTSQRSTTQRSTTQRSTTQRSTSQRSATTRQSSGTQSTTESKPTSHGTTIELPFVTARFHTPDLSLPSGEDVAAAAQNVRNQLPSTERTLFLGALTLGAAFAWIEWPVALVIGVGTALASQGQQEPASAE